MLVYLSISFITHKVFHGALTAVDVGIRDS